MPLSSQRMERPQGAASETECRLLQLLAHSIAQAFAARTVAYSSKGVSTCAASQNNSLLPEWMCKQAMFLGKACITKHFKQASVAFEYWRLSFPQLAFKEGKLRSSKGRCFVDKLHCRSYPEHSL